MAKNPIPAPCEPVQITEFFAEDRRFTGVYFLLRHGAVVYVGQSKTIMWRVEAHLAEAVKKFDAVAFIQCEVRELDRIKRHYIRKLVPFYNKCSIAKKTREERGYRPRKPRWSLEAKRAAKIAA